MTPLLLLLYEFFLFSKVVGVCLCCCVKIKTVKTHIFSSVHLALSSFFFVKKCFCQLCCVCVCLKTTTTCNIAHHHQSFVQRLYNQFAFDRPKGGGEEEEEEDKEEEEEEEEDFVKVY